MSSPHVFTELSTHVLPSLPHKTCAMDTHALFCECGCSNITHTQAAPYNSLILTPAKKKPTRARKHTPSMCPCLLHPVPSAQQLGTGYSQPPTERMLHQVQKEVTVLLGRLLALPHLVSIWLVVWYHTKVCPPCYKFSCFCYNSA